MGDGAYDKAGRQAPALSACRRPAAIGRLLLAARLSRAQGDTPAAGAQRCVEFTEFTVYSLNKYRKNTATVHAFQIHRR